MCIHLKWINSCHSKTISSICCIHLPPSRGVTCHSSVSKWTWFPSNPHKGALANFLGHGWRKELMEFAGSSWRTFFPCSLSCWDEFQKSFYEEKAFLVNVLFSRLIITVAPLNPKIPWVGRWGEITCSFLIIKLWSGNPVCFIYVPQKRAIYVRSKPGIFKSRYIQIGGIINFN